jgi:hypothetical protein
MKRNVGGDLAEEKDSASHDGDAGSDKMKKIRYEEEEIILRAWNCAYDCVAAVEGNADKLRNIAVGILMEEELISRLDHSCKESLGSFIEAIQSHYRSNPYHNFEHAVHVLCSTNILLNAIRSPCFSSLERFALLFSALVHDVDHLGVSNTTLVSNSHPYALLYNDRNVAEMRSITLAFELLEASSGNFYSKMSPQDKAHFRKFVVDIILSTDIADKSEERRFFADFDSELSMNCDCFDFSNVTHRLYSLVMMMKVADLGASLQQAQTSQFWSERFFTEFLQASNAAGKSPIDVNEFIRLQAIHYSNVVPITVNYLQKTEAVSEDFGNLMIRNLDVNKKFWETEDGRKLCSKWVVTSTM